jgi:hypothetical protein
LFNSPKKVEKVEITKWTTQQNEVFYLAYIQNDALKTYNKIYYHHDGLNYFEVTPLCICNYRNELMGEDSEYSEYSEYSFDKFSYMEKRVKYVIGYCYDEDKYKKIGHVNYYGDYEEGSKVPIYQRRFWYMK